MSVESLTYDTKSEKGGTCPVFLKILVNEMQRKANSPLSHVQIHEVARMVSLWSSDKTVL